MQLAGLYVLTDDKVHAHQEWPARVEQVILGGASIIQLREKNVSDDELLPIAGAIQDVCMFYNALFIVNDRVHLAKRVSADGVHIGQQDTKIRHAREYLGKQYLIGASCYRNPRLAIQATKQGADYVAFGSMFSSSTKPNAPRCSLSVLRSYQLSLPVCAIGGINAKNAQHVVDAGADMLAVSYAVFNAKYPQQAANALAQKVIINE